MKVKLKSLFWEETDADKMKEKTDKLNFLACGIAVINTFIGTTIGNKPLIIINAIYLLFGLMVWRSYVKWKENKSTN